MKSGYPKYDARSAKNLVGVHPDLVKVIERAGEITSVPFVVIEGVRTPERQAELVKSGASQTRNSRHLYGMAVDIAPVPAGELSWAWPLYFKLAEAVNRASNELDIPVIWGGDWRKFKDGPHFELARQHYPDPEEAA